MVWGECIPWQLFCYTDPKVHSDVKITLYYRETMLKINKPKFTIYSISFAIFLIIFFFIGHRFATGIELALDELKLTQEEMTWLKSKEAIKIGGPRAFPPFHYFDDQGHLKGISADYIFAIMNKLGVKLEVQENLPWTEVLNKAKAGKIDLIPCAAKTIDRESYLNFSTPYLSFPLVILTSKDAPYIGGIEDLYGKKLAVIQKNATSIWLKRDKIKFEPYYVKSPLKKLEAISFGIVDAGIENLAAASYIIQKYGLTNVKIAAPTQYGNYNLHMAVRKDLPELLGIINKVIDLVTPEQHMQIRSKWLSVRYEHGIKNVDILKWILAISIFSLTIIVIILFWNRRLKKAEGALKESERKLSTLIDNLPGIAYQCLNDVNWTMLYISNGCYELTGYEPFELIKNQILSYGDLIVEDDRQYVENEIQIATNERRPFAIEYRIRDKNQNIKWLWEKGREVFDKEKNLSSLEGFITDITEHKQAEEINKTLFTISSAVNTTQSLKDLFQSIHNSLGSIIDVTNFFIAMVDTKKRTLYFPYHIDTTDDDFSPITNFDTNDSLTGLVVSQRRPILFKRKDLEKRASQNGIWGPTPLIWMGVPLIVKDEIIGVVAAQSYSNENLYTKQDLRVFSMVSDQISIAIDRKRAEEALRENEKKYRHLFQNAPAGIYEIDFEKVKFINVNEVMCKYSGYSEKELLTLNPLDLLTKDSKNLFIGRLEKLSTEENQVDSIEYNVIKKNGRELCVILNNDYIYRNGKLTGSRVVVHDISKLKQAQEEKIKAQQIAGEQKKLALVGQVAGKMAHDFNNILGIIMGNTELSLMDCKDAEIKKTLELIFEQTLRGKNLTRNLVAFAKDQEPKQEFFRISEKIDLVFNLLKKDLQGVELIKEDKPGVPDLLADPGMIEHALINLIQNSIHAISMSEYPKIVIKTYCFENNIYLEIEDNGCGIPKENLGNIYEPSFTLKGTKDMTGSYGSGIKGTGYGMANVKKYIEQHKGNISVESEFGSGTKFTISLPVIKKELTSEEKTEIQKEKIYFDKYILLVEDEPAILGVQYKILSQEPFNHKVDIANDGQVAMDLFKRNRYDLISLDYALPGEINGMDVYNHIRATNKTIPILFISGNIEFLESIKDLKHKDTNIEHLSKPCQNKEYVNSINQLLKKTLIVE
jgi:PAS domain S-box-containing protein